MIDSIFGYLRFISYWAYGHYIALIATSELALRMAVVSSVCQNGNNVV